jgi:phage tail sheath gpL-like
VTASAGSAGVVIVLTFKVPGPWGNDTCLRAFFRAAPAAPSRPPLRSFTGGTTEPDFTTALNTLSGTEYELHHPLLLERRCAELGSTSNPGRLKTKINSLNTGLNAKLQRGMVGLTGTLVQCEDGCHRSQRAHHRIRAVHQRA